MPGTHHQLLYHLVFSTKNRKPYLQSETRAKVFEYLGGTVKGLEGIPLIVGGWVDHVHLLVKLTTQHRLSDFMRALKAGTSKHVNETSGLIHKFGWQDGYGAFTVGKSQEATVRNYIANQEQHHSKETFEAEYVRMLDLSGLEYDPRYLWD
jgi:REP element-mobilizing transposase RayT